MCVKKLSIFLLVLLVASSFAWALPGAKKTTQAATPTAVVEVPETSTSAESQSSTESVPSETSTNSEELLALMEKNDYLWGADDIKEVKSIVEDIALDIEVSNAINAAQTDQIDSLKKELKATRFFADAGVAFGFTEGGINYGVAGDMGIKFGKGLITKVGVQYMLGNLTDITNLQWNIENMTVQATVGWEW